MDINMDDLSDVSGSDIYNNSIYGLSPSASPSLYDHRLQYNEMDPNDFVVIDAPSDDFTEKDNSTYRDKWCFFAFLIQITLYTLCSLVFIIFTAVRKSEFIVDLTISNASGIAAVGCSLGCVFSILFTLLWLMLTVSKWGIIIRASSLVFFGIFLTILIANVVLFSYWAVLGITIIALIFFFWYMFTVRKYILFTDSITHTIFPFIRKHSSLLLFALATIGLSLILTLFWLIGASAMYLSLLNYSDSSKHDSIVHNNISLLQVLIWLWCFFSLYWTLETVTAGIHAVTSGYISEFWMKPSHPSVLTIIKRILNRSVGSLATGAMFVTIIDILRVFFSENSCCNCVSVVMTKLLVIFNSYAYVNIATQATSFTNSAYSVDETVKNEDFSKIVAADLSSTATFSISTFTAAVASVLFGYPLYHRYHHLDYTYLALTFVFIFIVAYYTARALVIQVQAATATTLLVWAETPHVIQDNNPEAFAELVSAKDKYL